ncbi:asparagine synthase C-terminal domain-containing protein [Caldicellulosiruptor naganoensis]|uniref:asparagine synthase (glutamine-hydrolyzing) n=1 Tax=Caldicellulosiruptor naganoensis TaxID=29324 RepID=A0ABY7BI22_9FIRM|nr:asparagine synthase C-terminal domain-containing protein [Caldicellulosiruptor naganoensis]
MSMTNSLEVRVPFADYRLVEFLYNIPWKVKYLENAEKGVLRSAFEDLIPEIVKNRKKSPYPKTYNPRYLKNVSEKVKKIIESHSPIFEIINKEQLKEILDNPNFTFEKPWFGQLMTLPQFFGYIVQLDFWAKHYNVNFE